MKYCNSKQKGSVLAFSLIVLAMLLISGIAVVSVASVERKSAFATQRSVLAFQAADSGAERVIKRLYIDNNPLISSVPLNAAMPDIDLDAVASNLPNVVNSGVDNRDCVTTGDDRIVAKNNATPDYYFEITFYDTNGNVIACNDQTWRDTAIKMKSEGFYRSTSRVVEIGIRPRQ